MSGMDALLQFFVPGFILGALAAIGFARLRRRSHNVDPVEPGRIIGAPTATEADAYDEAATNHVEPIAHSRLIDVGAARATGFNMKHADDLTIIEGIGPKIEDLLRANGVDGLAALAALDDAALAEILERGGASFRFANPSDWTRQAALAADNQWAELKQMQRERIGDSTGSL